MRFFFLFPLLFVLPAHAQPTPYATTTFGTGFVVNREGDIVTNTHVVEACQSIAILTPGGAQPATLVARDRTRDLAVLRAATLATLPIAPLPEHSDDLRVGDTVTVSGFHGDAGRAQEAKFKETAITSLRGPGGEPTYFELRHVAEQGNSGGPVLDSGGNVIGVITGIAELLPIQPDGSIGTTVVDQTDYAITLTSLRAFLQEHRIPIAAATAAENKDRRFIVPIRCTPNTISQ